VTQSFEFNTNALIHHLRENNLQPELHKETGQVYVLFHMNQYEVPIFFLLRQREQLLQIVAYLPYLLPEKSLGETARLLHILNREIDMPGFGLDESEKLLFYRCVLPGIEGRMDKKLFDLYFGTARVACETFMQVIGMIVAGTMTLDQALKGPSQ
jgi:hypothetical protein